MAGRSLDERHLHRYQCTSLNLVKANQIYNRENDLIQPTTMTVVAGTTSVGSGVAASVATSVATGAFSLYWASVAVAFGGRQSISCMQQVKGLLQT
jgi:hypothetical protein